MAICKWGEIYFGARGLGRHTDDMADVEKHFFVVDGGGFDEIGFVHF